MTAPLPPDRAHVETEQRHAGSGDLDRLPTAGVVRLLVDDQARGLAAVMDRADSIAALIDEIAPRMRRGGRLVYVGAGTSGRLGVLDASECPPTFQSDPGQVIGLIAGGDAALRKSSEGLEDDRDGALEALERLDLGKDDTLIGVTAGGTTPYVLGALALARSRGSATALITCAAPADAPDPPAERVIVVKTGAEVLTGSTRLKAGTATKAILNAISTALFVRLGKVHGNLMVDLRATNDKLRDRALRVLAMLDPDLSRGAAAALLDAAGGSVKVAALMHRHGLDRVAAQERLLAHGGALRPALDP